MGKPKPKKPVHVSAKAEDVRFAEIREHMAAGRWREAMKVAAGFERGAEKVAIQRAWEAFARPDFLRQMGKDPEALIAEGKAALLRRYPLSE